MRISVEGLRTSLTDWRAARDVAREELPPLTTAQKEVATELNISEEDYQRSVLAGERTLKQLLAKTQRFGQLLEQKVRAISQGAAIEHVVLNTWEDRFEVEMTVNGGLFPLRVAEAVVDDLFESGSMEAERRLSRILELAFSAEGVR